MSVFIDVMRDMWNEPILAIEIHRRHCLAVYDSIERMANIYIDEVNVSSHSIEMQKTIFRSWALRKQANAREFS